LKQQQEIDRLGEENARLKDRLRYQERTAREGAFGSSTPSSKIPLKPGAPPAASPRPGGARPGHRGHGRRRLDRTTCDCVQRVPVGERCPDCGARLQHKGVAARTVADVEPLRRQVIRYELEQKYCPRCRRAVAAPAPGVLPRNLLGNRLLAHVAVQHYVYGVTLGQLENQLGVGYGTLMGALHQLAGYFEPVIEPWVREYRRAPPAPYNTATRTCCATWEILEKEFPDPPEIRRFRKSKTSFGKRPTGSITGPRTGRCRRTIIGPSGNCARW